MRTTLLAAAAVVVASWLPGGCVVDIDDGPGVWIGNHYPELVDADAGCFWDAGLHSDVWYFEADVWDRDGASDIWLVEAHVYDDVSGHHVQSFDLYPTWDRWLWYSDWRESATKLDCFYWGYSVDFVVWDDHEAWDRLAVVPNTY